MNVRLHPDTLALIKRHLDAGHVVYTEGYIDGFGVLAYRQGITIQTDPSRTVS